MHAEAFRWLRDTMDNYLFDEFFTVDSVGHAHLDREPRILEFGSRDINGSARNALPLALSYPSSHWTGIDLEPGDRVDIVGDAATIDLTPAAFDLVVCTEVLEHAVNWPLIIRNAANHLVPGGWLFVTCAGPGRLPHSAVDGLALREGEWYMNILPEDLDRVLLTSGFARRRVEYVAETADELRPNGTYDTYAWAVR